MKLEEQRHNGKIRGKFSSTCPYPHDLPYQEYYAEKVPLLTVFGMAVGHFVTSKSPLKMILTGLTNLGVRFLGGDEFLAVECGVYKGHSLIACAEIARDKGVKFHFYGLDTFAGLPPLSEVDRKMAPPDARYLERPLFGDTSLEEVTEKIQEKRLDRDVTLVPGLFKDTLATLADKEFWFVSIDCDLYEPHLECLDFFYPRMKRGGIIFFDDYHSLEYPMGRVAIDQFLSNRSEKLFHIRYGEDKPNHLKTYLVKH